MGTGMGMDGPVHSSAVQAVAGRTDRCTQAPCRLRDGTGRMGGMGGGAADWTASR